MGLKAFAITSDGVEYPNHKYLSKSQKKLAKLQRQLPEVIFREAKVPARSSGDLSAVARKEESLAEEKGIHREVETWDSD